MLHIIRYRVEYGIETQIKNGEKSLRISMALGKQRNQFQIKLLFIFIDFMFYVYIWLKKNHLENKKLLNKIHN